MKNTNIASMQASGPPIASQPQFSRSSPRNEAVDFIKGFLVVGMVVYHATNYFAAQYNEWLSYIKFVSGGFIFISGYIVATFYAAKWAADPGRVAARLLIRGFKLVALFTLINLVISLLSVRNFNEVEFGLQQFTERIYTIYVIGGGKYAAFEILLPIGYLLVVSPAILWLQRWRALLLLTLAVLLASSFFLRWHLNNFVLLMVGGVGVLVGLLVPPGRIAARGHLWASVPSLVISVTAVPWLRQSLAGYILYILVVFKCVADLSSALPPHWLVRKCILQMGEYVLFCYLSHIIILQAIFRLAWPQRESPVVTLVFIVVVTLLLLIGCVVAIRFIRQRSLLLDRVYRFVFA